MNRPLRKGNLRNLKSLLIEPFIQIKIGLYVLLVVFVFVMVMFWLFWTSFSQQYQNVMEIFQIVNPENKIRLITDQVFITNIQRLVVFLVTFIIVLFAVILKATHRIFGPVVAIDRFVKDIIEGNYDKRIITRKGDELQHLVKNLNRMAEVLERRHRQADKAKGDSSS